MHGFEQKDFEIEEVHGVGGEYGTVTWPYRVLDVGNVGQYIDSDSTILSSGTIMGDGCSAMAVYDHENQKSYMLHCPLPDVEGVNSAEIVGKTFSKFFYENTESVGSSDYYIVTSFPDIDDYLDNELTDPGKKAILGSYETAELTVNPPQQPDINVRIGEKEVARTATPQDKYNSPRKAV